MPRTTRLSALHVPFTVALLNLLVAVPYFAQADDVNSIKCDRAASREAKRVLLNVLEPRMQKMGYIPPESCPLDASKDIYKVQEAHKVLLRKNVWKCTWDQKVFRGENFIDMHMEKRHSHDIEPGATTCLASMCGPLHCDFFEHTRKGKLHHLKTTPCHGRTMDTYKENCYQLAHHCFPLAGGRAAERMHAFMTQTFCEAATCLWSKRVELLQPHSGTQEDGQYLRSLMIGFTVVALVVVYTILALTWSSKTATESNSLQFLLRKMGIFKPKTRKFL